MKELDISLLPLPLKELLEIPGNRIIPLPLHEKKVRLFLLDNELSIDLEEDFSDWESTLSKKFLRVFIYLNYLLVRGGNSSRNRVYKWIELYLPNVITINTTKTTINTSATTTNSHHNHDQRNQNHNQRKRNHN